MKIKYFIIGCLIAFTLCGSSAAQTYGERAMRNELNSIFCELNKSRVPTGLLLDYAIEYIDISLYNGENPTNSSIVDRYTFTNILKTLYSSAVTTPPFENPNQIWGDLGTTINSDGEIMLLATLFKYNKIKDNALTEGLVSYINGKVIDKYIDGTWVNPYEESFVFAFAPSSDIITKSEVCYKFLIPQSLRNCNISQLYFDADDNSGYRLLNSGSLNIIQVNYSTDGIKNLRLKAILTNGDQLESQCQVFIASKKKIKINGTDDVPPQFIMQEFTSADGSVSANVAIKLGSDNDITKPFIIVEGFDPVSIDLLNVNNKFGSTSYDKFYNNNFNWKQNPFLEYDYIYIDWFNSTADITKNADLLIDIIEYINEIKISSEPLVIMGQSMGGLITRYALCTMELINKPHCVSTFISHDVPHLGANVPLGLIYLFHQLYCCLKEYDLLILDKLTKNIGDAYHNILHSDAAKQMLINYVDVNGNLNNTVHEEWQSILYNLGFPKGDIGKDIENIAIINGKDYQIKRDLIDDKYLLNVTGRFSTTLLSAFVVNNYLQQQIESLVEEQIGEELTNWQKCRLAFNKTSVDVDVKVQPLWKSLAKDEPLSKLNLQLNKTIKFLDCEINGTLYDSTIAVPNNLSLYYDDCCGSVYEIIYNGFDVHSTWLYEVEDFNIDFAKEFLFIPSCSALSISNITQNTLYSDFYDYSYKDFTQNLETPFDSFYLANKVQQHITCDRDIFIWIHKQMKMKIEGPGLVTHSANFNVSGVDTAIDWESSDEEIAYFDDNGKLIAKGNGFVTITASSYNKGQLYRKQKVVKVGMPEFCITKQYYPNVGYQFTATVTDSEAEYINELVANGDAYFEWKLIDSNGELKEIESSGATATYMVAEDELVTIAVCLVNSDGNKSPMRTLTLNLQTPFSVNYKYMVVDSMNHFYWVKEDGTYETGSNTEDLIVTFRHLPLGSEDNLTTLVSKYIGNGCTINYDNMRQSMSVILHGEKVFGQFKWVFPFFDQDSFTQDVRIAMALNEEESLVVSNYDMRLVNSRNQVVQYIPFAVLYKPVFPDPLAPPIQFNPIED